MELAISAITLDSRWGIPRFNSKKESEIYLLDGEQLMYPKLEYNGEKYDYMPNRPLMVEQNGSLHPITSSDSRMDRNGEGTRIFYASQTKSHR